MKKNFEQPELQVVQVKNNDIITDSLTVNTSVSVSNQFAPGQRGLFDPYNNSWDAGY